MEFKSRQALLNHFNNEEVAKAHFEQLRWGGTVCCVHCGSTKVYRTQRGFVCGEKQCLKKFTAKTGTIFQDSKIPFTVWFAAIYECINNKKGKSSHQLARDLGVTQKTAWFVLHRIREMLQDKEPTLLRGVVSVDETGIGGITKNKHKNKVYRDPETGGVISTKKTVFGAVERKGKAFLKVVDQNSKEQIIPLLEKHIEKGSFMVSDESKVYHEFKSNKAYGHESVNHGAGEYVRNGFSTNNVENVWSLLKRGINGIYHQVSKEHLNSYCVEYAFRFNSRDLTDIQRWGLTLTKADGVILKHKTLIARMQTESSATKLQSKKAPN